MQLYSSTAKEFKSPKILLVRSFAKIYNPLMAVNFFIKIKAIFPEAKICMVRSQKDDSHRKTLKFAQKNNIEVLFTGKLSKIDWIELSKDYNIFINTTQFDNALTTVI
jgi:hypothetical protein